MKSLSELKQALDIAATKLQYTYAEETRADQRRMVIRDLRDFRQGVSLIDDLGLFSNDVEILKDSIIFATGDNVVSIRRPEGDNVVLLMNSFYKLVLSLQNVTTRLIPPVNANSIIVTIKRQSDFSDLSEISLKINQLLSQAIYNPSIDGTIVITSVENGSYKFTVDLNTVLAVSLVAAITWSGAVVYKKYQEAKLIEAKVASLHIENEAMEALKDGLKKEIEQLINLEASNICNEYSPNDNDHEARIKHSIRLMSELIEIGTEIQPGLMEPESVKNLFPDWNSLPTIESRVKQLPANGTDEPK